MASLQLHNLAKTFLGKIHAVDDVSLYIVDQEYLTLVGPSGCGKSTLLRLIAGLETSDCGQIRLGDSDISKHAPHKRDVAMVFQNYALYPHKTVLQNLSLPLKWQRIPSQTVAQRVQDVANSLDLTEFLQRKPAQTFRRATTTSRFSASFSSATTDISPGRTALQFRYTFAFASAASLNAFTQTSQADIFARHARSARSHESRATPCRHERRKNLASRRAHGDLRQAQLALRREIHRFSGNECLFGRMLSKS